MAAYLSEIASYPEPKSSLARVLWQNGTRVPRIIELGSGCGIVGSEVVQSCPESDILMTDLPEAMNILEYNVDKARSISNGSKVETAVLDWDAALLDSNSKRRYDVVFVSDCTYNSDSIPALVRTLLALVERSPTALIVVSMKIRHDSEAIFFDLMATAKFYEIDHVKISLPDRPRQERGQPLEAVDICIYSRNSLTEDG